MARGTRPLSVTQIKSAKPKEKEYRLYDGNKLSLVIFKNGKKKWRYEYTFNKKRNTLSLGGFPDVSLKEAREIAKINNAKLEKGINPKSEEVEKETYTLNDMIQDFLKTKIDWTETTRVDMIQRIEKNILPYIGDKEVEDVNKKDILFVLKIIIDRGATENAKKIFSLLNMTYKYGSTLGKVDRNILADLDKTVIIPKRKVKNFDFTIDEDELGDVLFAIDNYRGEYNTKVGLQLLPFLFVRPSNLRFMEWSEIDFKKKLWIVPKEKMKTNIDFIVPLSSYVFDVLEKHKSRANGSSLVFPSIRSRTIPLSENTFNTGLKRMGFKLTAHGFRHTASTLLHENIHIHKIPSEVIETQLAHQVGNSVHRTYNKAQYIEERIRLMDWWTNYLLSLKI